MKEKITVISCPLAISIVFIVGLAYVASGCTEAKGLLTINLTDDPAQYDEVFITFNEVAVHRGDDNDLDQGDNPGVEDDLDDADEPDDGEGGDDSWIIVSTEAQGYDLLTLQDGKSDLLVQTALEVGMYTQVRLKIVNDEDENEEPRTYISMNGNGERIPLLVPSGLTSGLKLVHPFFVAPETDTVLYLDFDAEESVVEMGNNTYKLKPTIRILNDLGDS